MNFVILTGNQKMDYYKCIFIEVKLVNKLVNKEGKIKLKFHYFAPPNE